MLNKLLEWVLEVSIAERSLGLDHQNFDEVFYGQSWALAEGAVMILTTQSLNFQLLKEGQAQL